jgi:hypothetical protein
MKTIKLLILCLLLNTVVYGTDYYVATSAQGGSDSNDGTALTDEGGGVGPKLTINAGIALFNAGDGADTLYIRGGTYRETVVMGKTGTAANRLTITNYNSETVYVSGCSPITGWSIHESGPIYTATFSDTYLDSDSIRTPFIYESNVLLNPGNTPNWDLPIDPYPRPTNSYDVDDEDEGQTSVFSSAQLPVVADDYYNGAFLKYYSVDTHTSHWSYLYSVADYDGGNKEITMTPAMSGGAVEERDSFIIYNHLNLVTGDGLFYIDPTPAGGSYTIYLDPTDTGVLETEIEIATATSNFTYNNSGGYFTVDGLNFYGSTGSSSAGNIYVTTGKTIEEVIIQNCTFEDAAYACIGLNSGNNTEIKDNTVKRSFNFGILNQFMTGDDVGNQYYNIEGNTVTHTERTNILVQRCDYGYIVENICNTVGTHGNGIAVYYGSDKFIVGNNTILATNGNAITSNTFAGFPIEKLVIWGNDTKVVPYRDYMPALAFWWKNNPDDAYDDYVYIAYNTFQCEYKLGINVLGNPIASYALEYFRNNITHGAGNGTILAANRSDNLYTYKDGLIPPWTLEGSEIDGTSDFAANTIFLDRDNHDQHIKSISSPQYYTGANLTSEITTLGLVADFPNFDFSVDKDGVTRHATTPSIGAYEWPSGSPPDTTPPTGGTPAWIAEPSLNGSNQATMEATAYVDAETPPTYYKFVCEEDASYSSAWQLSTTYTTASPITTNPTYTFKFYCKDSAPLENTSSFSSGVSVSLVTYLLTYDGS